MKSENLSSRPDNNLIWAILATVLCCMPLGIVAIIKAAKVDSLWYQGKQEEARKAAKEAKNWSIYSAASILLIFVILFAFGFIGALFDGAFNY